MSFSPTPHIAVVILNWNGWEDTIVCLESLLRSDYPDFRIILVDNGSTNDSLKRIEVWCAGKIPVISYDEASAQTSGRDEPESEECQTPSGRPLVIIRTGENLGFAEGNNVGIRYALNEQRPADLVFLLNNDTQIEPEAMSRAVAVIRQRDAGIVGFLIKDSSGTQTLFAGDLRPPELFYIPYSLYLSKHAPGDEPTHVVWGTAMLIRRDVLRAHETLYGHFLNSAYFLYMEDYEFCFHVQQMGFSIVIAKKAVVHHKHIDNFTRLNFNNAITLYYVTRNTVLLAKSLLSLKWRLVFYTYYPLARCKDVLILLLKGRSEEVRALLDGLCDGYRGAQGKWRKHPSGEILSS